MRPARFTASPSYIVWVAFKVARCRRTAWVGRHSSAAAGEAIATVAASKSARSMIVTPVHDGAERVPVTQVR